MLEEDLVLVIDLGLCETLVTLIAHISEPLLESHFFRVVELFEVGELLLRSHINLIDSFLKLLFAFFKLFFKLVDFFLQALLGLLNILLVLSVLFLAQGEVLVTLLFGLSQGLTQALNLFLEVLHRQSQLKLSLRQAFRQVADDRLTLLHLAHIRLSQSLDLILVCLVELIDLVLRLLFANHRLSGVVLERLKNSLMVKLHFLFLLLFLLQLKPHELVLLLGHSRVLHSLAFQRFILLFQLLDNLLKLLNPLAIRLLFLLLRFIFLPQFRIKSSLKRLVVVA